MPRIQIKPTLSDFRFLEAIIVFMAVYMGMLGDFFEQEHYRFWTLIFSLGCALAYLIIKIAKDQHNEKIANEKASSLANLDQKG